MINAEIELYKFGETGIVGSDDKYLGIVPISFQFKVNVIEGIALSFLWDFGDGGSSTIREPSHTYYDTGRYHVILIVSDGSDSTTAEFDIYLGKLDFKANVVKGISPFTVQFQNKSVAPTGSYFTGMQWDFGDGSTGMVYNPEHTFVDIKKYSIGLRAYLSNT